MTDYFKVLELDPHKLLSLSDDDAKHMVERAYDNLVNTANQGDATEHPRTEMWEDAKNKLCDRAVRRYYAVKLGYLREDAEPAHEPEPYEPPTYEPAPTYDPPRPSDHSTGPPWWGAAPLVAAPGVLLYLVGAGAVLAEPGMLILWLGSFLMAWTITKTKRGALFVALIVGSVAAMLASWSYDGFARDVASWNAPPSVVAAGLLIMLGALLVKIRGPIMPWVEIGEWYAARTLEVFILAVVLIPVASAIVPLREAGTVTEPPESPPPICAPTSEIEEGLDLGRPERRLVQAGLAATGHPTGTIDGLFGPRTRAAIREWQQAQTNCTATGFLNQRQADSLMALAPANPADRPVPRAPGEPRGPEPPTETARSRVVIEAEPGSEISIDNEAVGTIGETGALPVDDILPGQHVLTASRPGFEPITRTIEVVAGISQVVSLTFQPLPGRLTVTANVDNAYVEIDTGYNAFAPVTDIEVNAGTRQVTVSSPGYEPDQQMVTVPPDGAVTHHATLEPYPVEEWTYQIERMFSSGAYEDAATTAGNLVQVFDSWTAAGVDVDPEDLSRALTIAGRSLFELNQFEAAAVPLYRAVLAGGRVELPVKHRHGGGGLRPGFCRGTLFLSLNEVRFESVDDTDHGFAVPRTGVTNIERAAARNGFLFRLNTEVEGRGDMDFVHPNAERQARDPDSGLQIDLVCPDCDQALEVHAALLLRLSES